MLGPAMMCTAAAMAGAMEVDGIHVSSGARILAKDFERGATCRAVKRAAVDVESVDSGMATPV